jgi:RNA polymerase sigma factor (sigma-70 family)
MRDSEVVASIVAGDPEGLAAAYDKYSADLYGYCQSLLREPDDAADAVQDTFVIAASKLAGLRDPERLRAWLFAVARNECLRRLKSRRAATPLQDAPEPADDSVDVGGAAERAEIVALVRAAVGGLNDGERDVINQFRHGLEVPEVAAVLGVSRNYAYTLFSRARDQLAASVAVLVVGRAGRRDCATLDSLLGDWDGRLTALLRKRVGRHIDRCQVCSDRRRQELTPALLYGLSPAALLATALSGGGGLITARQLAGPLSGVRDAVLRLASDPGSHAAAYRAASGRSTHSFGMTGFPKPTHHGYLGLVQRLHLPFAAVGGTAVITAGTVVVTVAGPHLHTTHGSPDRLTSSAPVRVAAPVPVAVPAASVTGGSMSIAPAGTAASGPTKRGTRSVPGSADSSTAPGPTVSGGTTSASPPATAPGGASASSGSTGALALTLTVSPTTLSSGSPSAGTVTVSPTTVLLSPLLGGTLTLSASGGPVSWSISEPASLLGKLTVNPSLGTLSAGGTVTVTMTVVGLTSLDTQLTVQPGGQPVTLLLGPG